MYKSGDIVIYPVNSYRKLGSSQFRAEIEEIESDHLLIHPIQKIEESAYLASSSFWVHIEHVKLDLEYIRDIKIDEILC